MSMWMKSYGMTIQMKATEQYFPEVLFIMMYKVILTFESVDEMPLCVAFEMRPIRWNFAWYYLFQRIFVKCLVLFLVTSTELPRSRGASLVVAAQGAMGKTKNFALPLCLCVEIFPVILAPRLLVKILRGTRSSQLDTT